MVEDRQADGGERAPRIAIETYTAEGDDYSGGIVDSYEPIQVRTFTSQGGVVIYTALWHVTIPVGGWVEIYAL